MIYSIANLLSADDLVFISNQLDQEDFIDGKKTAGWSAKAVKKNTQLSSQATYSQKIKDLIRESLKKNLRFESGVKPKMIHSMLISRYAAGMSYGTHVDNALMSKNFYRSDVSLTIFLNPPSDYEGGELVIEEVDQERKIKLDAGSAIIYPSSTLHRVEPVTTGIRIVAVAWVQSLVRAQESREILFELDQVRRSLFAESGKTRNFNLLNKTYTNLLRQWADY